VFLWFPVDWLQIGWWPLRGSSPTALWSCLQSFVVVGEVLVANREIFGWRRFFSSSVLRIPVRPPLHPGQTGFCIPVRPPSHPGQTALASRSGQVGNHSEATRSDRPSIPVRPALQANPVRPALHPGQTGFAQFKWLVLSRFGRLSSVSRIGCCTVLLPFHRFYLGALVTSWLEYPKFRTLLLLHRSGVSRFLSFGSVRSRGLIGLLCGDPLCSEGTSTLF
jgi:hypothetical protein